VRVGKPYLTVKRASGSPPVHGKTSADLRPKAVEWGFDPSATYRHEGPPKTGCGRRFMIAGGVISGLVKNPHHTGSRERLPRLALSLLRLHSSYKKNKLLKTEGGSLSTLNVSPFWVTFGFT